MSTPDPLGLSSLIEMDLPGMLLRARLLLEGPCRDDPGQLAGILPALLLHCQLDAGQPERVLELVRRVATAAPQPAGRSLLEALERGVAPALRKGLVELLWDLGLRRRNLEWDCRRRLGGADPAERMRAMSLLCALGPAHPESRQAVLEADLGRFWWLEEARAAALAAAGAEVVPELIAALKHPDEGARARAEAALQRLGPDAGAAVPDLLLLPAHDGSEEAEGGPPHPSPALLAVGPAAVPALLKALEHPSRLVRGRALAVLDARKGEGPDVVPALLGALGDANERVYREATQALVWAGADADVAQVPEGVLPLYRHALSEAAERVRVGAAVALAMGGPADERVAEVLTLGLISPDEVVRWHAAWGLGALPDPPLSVVARACADEHLVDAFADRVGRRAPASEAVLGALAAAFLELESYPVAVRDALLRAGGAGAAAVLRLCLVLWQQQGDAPLRLPISHEPGGRASHLLVDMGLEAAAAVWRVLQECDEGEALGREQAVLLYRLLCACGASDEVVEVLRGHPSARVRALAAAGMSAAPVESAPGVIAALEDADEEVRREATLSAIGHWFSEGADPDWRERFVEATLRVLARAGLPADLDLAGLWRRANPSRLCAATAAVLRVCEQAGAEECLVLCDLLARAALAGWTKEGREGHGLRLLLRSLAARGEPQVRDAAEAVGAVFGPEFLRG